MNELSLSTTTEDDGPRVSGVDVHVLHGVWIFGTRGTSSAKA